MTAVEWLFENLCSEKLSWIKDCNGKLFFDETTSNIFQQAKEMEKQHIIYAFEEGYGSGYRDNGKLGSEYYDETFKK